MKNLKLFVLSLALSISALSFAAPATDDPKTELHDQILELLKSPDFDFKADELAAEVVFVLNEKAEIVVISVTSDDSTLENFIKSQLNYQKVDVKQLNQTKLYKVPVRIVKKV